MKSMIYLLVLSVAVATGQVPQIVSYEGAVSVTGQAFTGQGSFKFALVLVSAPDSVVWRNDGGAGPGEPAVSVNVPVTKAAFRVALGDTSLAGMAALPGSVFASNPPLLLRIWFNDGAHGFSQLTPDQQVTASPYALMAQTVPDGAITGAKLANGSITGAKLAPNAITADTLAPGAALANLGVTAHGAVPLSGVIFSEVRNNTALLSDGYAQIGSFNFGAERWTNYTDGPPSTYVSPRHADHTAVWTGTLMLIWGGKSSGSDSDDGLRYNPATVTWSAMNQLNAPSARVGHTAVWTGSRMIVWGGGDYLNTGGRYNPSTDTWQSTSTVGAPVGRQNHCAVWTGSYMIVWGGEARDTNGVHYDLNSGARYNPTTDTWAPISTANAPGPREGPSGVWTGTEMIVWGGYRSSSYWTSFAITNMNTGGRYNAASDTWTTLPVANAPSRRYGHSALWTGTEMIVWGGNQHEGSTSEGFSSQDNLNTGGRYNPSANTWSATTTSGAPSGRAGHTAAWIGSRMVIWGGSDALEAGWLGTPTYFNNGARYNPANNTWATMSGTGEPAGREGASAVAVAANNRVMIWGGRDGDETFDNGASYVITNDTWQAIAAIPPDLTGEPGMRRLHTAVWTGDEVIIWGGRTDDYELKGGGRFRPSNNTWTNLPATGAPSRRTGHSAVWTGTEMIIWGGLSSGDVLNTGARYNLAANSWKAMTMSNAPVGRANHGAVWTGTQMVIWGGGFRNGARYNPATDTWSEMNTNGAPSIRAGESFAWTGKHLAAWGGLTPLGGFAFKVHQDGGLYDPQLDTWTPIPTNGAPSERWLASMVWSGQELLVWGGSPMNTAIAGGRYDPTTGTWTPIPTAGAPVLRYNHTALWTGSQMIVYGGHDGTNAVATGARYNPVAGTWQPVAGTGIPSLPRYYHVAVWTGQDMVVHGGWNGTSTYELTDGYYPPRTFYLYVKQ
jgi:N-acetylneuraminic acid mutarotase